MGRFYEPPKNGRIVDRAFVHCDAGAGETPVGLDRIKGIDRSHKQRDFHPYTALDGGKRYFGYNDYIDPLADFYHVRPVEFYPQAQTGYNSRSVALCVAGLYLAQFRDDKLEVVRHWRDDIVSYHGDAVTFHGHKEVAAKACPVFDYVQVLGIVDPGIHGGHLRDTGGNGHGFPTPYPCLSRELSTTVTGPDVKLLQSILKIKADGIFGQQTRAAVVAFQRAHHLVPDGIVGPLTWKTFWEVKEQK